MEHTKPMTISKEKQYKSVLEREVPWCGYTSRDSRWDGNKCWHCQQNPRIRRDPDVIIWCMRCYTLHHKKGDGTFIRTDNLLPIGKDLLNNEENRKVFEKASKYDVGHKIDKVVVEE